MGACCSAPSVEQESQAFSAVASATHKGSKTNSHSHRFKRIRRQHTTSDPLPDPVPFPPQVDKSQKLEVCLLGRGFPDDLTESYEIGKVLGRGKFGVTRVVVDKKSQQTWACKSVLKNDYTKHCMEYLPRQELQLIHHLSGGRHTLQLKEALEDEYYIHYIMELCTGGDLVEHVIKAGHYSEADAAAVIREVCEAVAYMHDMGVMHRDIKLENFLYDKAPAQGGVLKVIDYGLSVFYKPDDTFREVTGTAYYMPPEMCKCLTDRECHYNASVDMWAAGVIMYMLLSGQPPFEGRLDEDVFDQILNRPPDIYEGIWESVSKEAKDLLEQLLDMDPAKRPSARTALLHPWLQEGGAPSRRLEPEILTRLKGYAANHKLKRLAMVALAKRRNEDELKGLQTLFESLDDDNDGTISLQELRKGMAKRMELGGRESSVIMQERSASYCPDLARGLSTLLDAVDLRRDAKLDWDEFVAAMLHSNKLLEDEENIRTVFECFDQDGDGHISLEELQDALLMRTGCFSTSSSGALPDAAIGGAAAAAGAAPAGSDAAAAGAAASSLLPDLRGRQQRRQREDLPEQLTEAEEAVIKEAVGILRKADTDGDGVISFDEFKQVMLRDRLSRTVSMTGSRLVRRGSSVSSRKVLNRDTPPQHPGDMEAHVLPGGGSTAMQPEQQQQKQQQQKQQQQQPAAGEGGWQQGDQALQVLT